LIDTHCHLNLKEFNSDFEQVIHQAKAAGVHKIFVPGVDLQTSKISIDIASKFMDVVFPFVGIHPNYSVSSNPKLIEELIRSNRKQIVAVGEIGLDFYRDYAPRKIQIELFNKMLNLARNFDLPVSIHNREADDEIIEILENWYSERSLSCNSNLPGILHAYNGSKKIAEWGKAYGFAFGIGGPVTYKKSYLLRETIKFIGLNNIVLETDAPYLTPVPHRGKRNVPRNIKFVVNTLSEIFEITKQKIEEITDKNAYRILLKNKCHEDGI